MSPCLSSLPFVLLTDDTLQNSKKPTWASRNRQRPLPRTKTRPRIRVVPPPRLTSTASQMREPPVRLPDTFPPFLSYSYLTLRSLSLPSNRGPHTGARNKARETWHPRPHPLRSPRPLPPRRIPRCPVSGPLDRRPLCRRCAEWLYAHGGIYSKRLCLFWQPRQAADVLRVGLQGHPDQPRPCVGQVHAVRPGGL